MPRSNVKQIRIRDIKHLLNQSKENGSFVYLPRGQSNTQWDQDKSFHEVLEQKLMNG